MSTRKYRNKRQTRKKQKGGGFSVQFQGKEARGNLRPREETLQQPTFHWNANPDTLYTVLMWDPDAPASSWIHLLVINIPTSDLSQGQTVISYTPPTPPSGTHRYFVTLYRQPQEISVPTPKERGNFNVQSFAGKYGLQKISQKMIRVSA